MKAALTDMGANGIVRYWMPGCEAGVAGVVASVARLCAMWIVTDTTNVENPDPRDVEAFRCSWVNMGRVVNKAVSTVATSRNQSEILFVPFCS